MKATETEIERVRKVFQFIDTTYGPRDNRWTQDGDRWVLTDTKNDCQIVIPDKHDYANTVEIELTINNTNSGDVSWKVCTLSMICNIGWFPILKTSEHKIADKILKFSKEIKDWKQKEKENSSNKAVESVMSEIEFRVRKYASAHSASHSCSCSGCKKDVSHT